MTMSEKYHLTVLAIGQHPEIEINKEYFYELKSAKQTLRKALACEEKYETAIYSYLDLEKECAGIAIQEMISPGSRQNDFFDLRLSVNIKIANLLSLTRLYTNSLPKDISACLQDKGESKDMIEKNKTEEYQNNFHYRFVHELRNHIQHKDLPIHSITTGEKLTKNKQIECFSDFFVSKTSLSEEGFNIEIFNQMQESVNLILAIRHYIEAVSKIHIQARGLIETKVTEARRCIESAVSQYKEAGVENNSVTNLYAINRNEQNAEIEKFALPPLLDTDDIRRRLKEKNGKQLTNLHRWYATTQTDREN